MSDSKKELVPVFSAVAMITTCSLIAIHMMSFRVDQSSDARLWVAVAAGLMTLFSLLWAFRRIQREMASAERATAALRESEERFRLLVENAKDYAFFMLDREGRMATWNSGAQQMTGYAAGEILGQHFSRFFTPEDLAANKPSNELILAAEQGSHTEEGWRIRKDGSRLWASVTVTAVRDSAGGLRGFAVIECNRTERKQVETTLRETEHRFRAVCDNARAAFGILVGTRLVYANPYFSELTGYSNEEILSMDFRQMTHPSFHELMLDRARRRLAGEPVPSHYEFLSITKSGEERWIDFSPAATELNGMPVIIGTGFDLTERKRAEAALKESEEKFRLLAEHSQVFICIFRDRRVLYANPYLVEISGYTQEEILSLDIADLIPLEDRVLVLDRACRRQHGEVLAPSYEYRLLDKSGEVHWVELWGVRIEYQGSAAVLAAGIDITERKRAEEELRRKEAQFRDLAEAMPQMVWIARPDGYLEYFNGRCYEYGGTSFEEAKGDGWSKWLHPDDYQRTMDRWRHSVNTGQPYEIEHRFRRDSDGAYRWFLGRALPVRDERGDIIRWFGTSTEIHEQKRLQEQLEMAQDAAEQAKQSSEEASRAKDHFLAVLSHELRTPLTPILAMAELLATEPHLDRETLQGLEVIRRNVELEARLIDDLLDVTRIARGKVELDKRLVLFCEVLRQAVEVCQPDIEARRLHFGVNIEAGPYWVEADAARLQQVLWNLIKNAVKFTPPGGCIGIRCRLVNDHLLAEVEDSGVGFEPEALSRIFNAFEQSERTITRQFGGLGLGLTISKTLVEMHGGTLEAFSAGKGKGATFRVRFPIVAEADRLPANACATPAATVQETAPLLRVLLVEDHGDTARIMTRLLKRRGYEVQTAGDVATALELAACHSFDLLISDLGLPDRSGVDLMRELRSRGQTLPAIALSGYGQEEDVNRSLEAGFHAHLTKPVDFEHFYRTINAVLQ